MSTEGRTWKIKQPWRSKRARMELYGCPPSCYPATLASNYYTMGWRWALTLTAPPGQLEASWAEWWEQAGQWDQVSPFPGREPSEIPGKLPFSVYGVAEMSYRFIPKTRWAELDRARGQLDRLRPDAFPFWIATFAIGQNRVPHIHMAVGGEIDYQRMRTLVSLWPGRYTSKPIASDYRAWGWLHYITAQEIKNDHRADQLSHCPKLLKPPVYSWNFEACLLAQRFSERMERERRKLRKLGRTRAAKTNSIVR
jgi:hypothetical protein